jgi:uncharacterized protein (TIGR03118 family)
VDRGLLLELAGLTDEDGVLSVYATVDSSAPPSRHQACEIRVRHELAAVRDRTEAEGSVALAVCGHDLFRPVAGSESGAHHGRRSSYRVTGLRKQSFANMQNHFCIWFGLNRRTARSVSAVRAAHARVVRTTAGGGVMDPTSREHWWQAGRAVVAALLAVPVFAASGVATAAAPESSGTRPAFTEVDLVSNIPGRAAVTDGNVQNAWGLALSPTSPLWAANNGTNTATLYAGGVGGAAPQIVPLVVTIPGGAPTGQVFNGTGGFIVSGPGGSGPARFLFVSEAGDLVGWNPTANPPVAGQSTATLVKHVDGAIYKGLTLATTAFGSFLLAADFHNARIDVFDSSFTLIQPAAPFFTDPALPAGYAPFNVAALGGKIYVAYAKQDAAAEDEAAGPGEGFVDVYNGFGLLERRLVRRGPLNAPWGLEIAPPSFDKFAGDLLVGNFGDGRITAVDRGTGHVDGQLRDARGKPIEIDGLWALLHGTASTGGTDSVWFSAGPNEEADGLVGQIRPAG